MNSQKDKIKVVKGIQKNKKPRVHPLPFSFYQCRHLKHISLRKNQFWCNFPFVEGVTLRKKNVKQRFTWIFSLCFRQSRRCKIISSEWGLYIKINNSIWRNTKWMFPNSFLYLAHIENARKKFSSSLIAEVAISIYNSIRINRWWNSIVFISVFLFLVRIQTTNYVDFKHI